MARIKTIEVHAMETYKMGMFFYTNKQDKDISALSHYYNRRIKTERLICIDCRYMNSLTKLLKVTFID